MDTKPLREIVVWLDSANQMTLIQPSLSVYGLASRQGFFFQGALAPFFPAVRFPNSSYCAKNRSNSWSENRRCRRFLFGRSKPRWISLLTLIVEMPRYRAASASFSAPRICSVVVDAIMAPNYVQRLLLNYYLVFGSAWHQFKHCVFCYAVRP
jgi:hypothetical protein